MISADDRDLVDAILRNLGIEHERQASGLVVGNPQSYDAYRHDVGFCTGLEVAANIIRETVKKWGREPDDQNGEDE